MNEMRVSQFKNKAQLETVLGALVFGAVQKMIQNEASGPLGRKLKRLPWSVSFHTQKPKFALHDYETMTAYAVDLATGEVSDGRYCGSGLSTINHAAEQLGQNENVPQNFALVFLTLTFGGGGNTAWSLDIVSPNIVPQLETMQAAQLKVGY